MKEVVGNLVVTDLQKYLEKPPDLPSATNEPLADAVNELSKRISYDFNRVRRSIIDAYEGKSLHRVILSCCASSLSEYDHQRTE
jgi:hypothetical protein